MHQITTLRDLRAAFWREHPDLQRQWHRYYTPEVHAAFADFTKHLARLGAIPETLAQRATL